MSEKLKIVFLTCPDEESSVKIARLVVEHRLAACVNIVSGIRSIYSWEAKIEDQQEYLLVMKTSPERIGDLEAAIIGAHPYETPEFVVVDTEYVNEKYLKWSLNQTMQAAAHK